MGVGSVVHKTSNIMLILLASVIYNTSMLQKNSFEKRWVLQSWWNRQRCIVLDFVVKYSVPQFIVTKKTCILPQLYYIWFVVCEKNLVHDYWLYVQYVNNSSIKPTIRPAHV